MSCRNCPSGSNSLRRPSGLPRLGIPLSVPRGLKEQSPRHQDRFPITQIILQIQGSRARTSKPSGRIPPKRLRLPTGCRDASSATTGISKAWGYCRLVVASGYMKGRDSDLFSRTLTYSGIPLVLCDVLLLCCRGERDSSLLSRHVGTSLMLS